MDRPQNSEKRPSLPSISSLNLGQAQFAAANQRPPPTLAPRRKLPPIAFDQGQEVYLDGLLLEEYNICGQIYTMQRPENEGSNVIQRKTIDTRTLQYNLTIIQEPAKARACGAGPRCTCLSPFHSYLHSLTQPAAADRRPVDPPPVVELRIFELVNEGELKETTMSYDASFMLHASLENARPIASGQRFGAPMSPVLTGLPVAAANYLDRPKPAAYFIFSDLSVRHEGWYRLRFTLLEQVKLPEDADPGMPIAVAVNQDPSSPAAGRVQTGMTNRMEVVSAPFQVFSAKKFPGLSESTELSRVVAEQGCRVRIRRDVRQRKRTSTKDEIDVDDDHVSYGEPSVPPTPVDRGHSASRSDFGGSQADHFRRQSMDISRSALQPRPSIDMPAAPVLVGHPALPRVDHAAAALIEMHQGGYTQPAMPPPTSLPIPSMAAQPPRPSYPSLPDVRAIPEVIIPSISTQRPERFAQPHVYDPATRQWNLPESSARKRSMSPRTDEVPDRQRPRLEMNPSPLARTAHVPAPPAPRPSVTSIASITNNGGMDAADDDDSEDSEIMSFEYKRADGTMSVKPVEQMRRMYGVAV
jgi:hypothetical protein